MDKKWTVFAPSQSKVVIKHEGKYFMYKHRDVLTEEEPFFKDYPRLFRTSGFVEEVAKPVVLPDVSKVEEEIAIEAEVKEKYETIADSIEKVETVDERRQIIIDVMNELDPTDEAHFTNSGKPDSKVVSEYCDFRVSAKERDEIWAEIQNSKEN